MSRIVIAIVMYHRLKPIELIKHSSIKNPMKHILTIKSFANTSAPTYVNFYTLICVLSEPDTSRTKKLSVPELLINSLSARLRCDHASCSPTSCKLTAAGSYNVNSTGAVDPDISERMCEAS
jgi:hypothetical protein